MKVFCSSHQGVVEIPGDVVSNEKSVFIDNLVIDCPICEDEVLINGTFDYDEAGMPREVV